MILKKYISVLTSVMLISGASLFSANAVYVDANNVNIDLTANDSAVASAPLAIYKITFLDFDGNVMKVLDVEEGDPIDYTSVDVSPLHKHLSVNVEQAFSSWDIHPDFADKDYTLHALSKTATISVNQLPTKTRYFTNKGDINTDGLNVTIKMSVQTSNKDQNGNYMTEDTVTDITSSCTISPSTLPEAFAKGDKATVTVYPIGDKKALTQYDITCYDNLGDVNSDGKIDSTDASSVLLTYVNLAATENYVVDDNTFKLSDVNFDGAIDARDASYILKYYAESSVSNETFDWTDIIDYDALSNNA